MKYILSIPFALLCLYATAQRDYLSHATDIHTDHEKPRTLAPHGLSDIRDVFEPVAVAVPPKDACSGLVQLPNGEIRHYAIGPDHSATGPWYMSSLDSGLTWKYRRSLPGEIGADFQISQSNTFLKLFARSTIDKGVYCAMEMGDGNRVARVSKISDFNINDTSLRNPLYVPSRSRIIIPGSLRNSLVFYSDDQGKSWETSDWISIPRKPIEGDDQSVRWYNAGVEPTLALLNDETVWMILRTSHDTFFESFSKDYGETWSTPEPSRFHGTNVMPTLYRMSDGRLLFIWCNTVPLPEFPKPESMKYFLGHKLLEGVREDVFTNRDVVHAAISDDDGKTWYGFRELYLTESRNAPNYGKLGFGIDKSLHQNQVIEIGLNKVLVSSGQNTAFRTMLAFDVDYLYEKHRKEDFSDGIDNLSVFQYVSGMVGWYSLDRKVGADIVKDPIKPENKVLKICRPEDPSLVIENQGAVWNFPSGFNGTVSFDLYLTTEFKGASISLTDRWFNPVDTTTSKKSIFNIGIKNDGVIGDQIALERGKWYQVKLSWKGAEQNEEGWSCEAKIEGVKGVIKLPQLNTCKNGVNYLHLQSTSDTEDLGGFLVDNLEALVK